MKRRSLLSSVLFLMSSCLLAEVIIMQVKAGCFDGIFCCLSKEGRNAKIVNDSEEQLKLLIRKQKPPSKFASQKKPQARQEPSASKDPSSTFVDVPLDT